MKKILSLAIGLVIFFGTVSVNAENKEAEQYRKGLVKYFLDIFPDTKEEDFIHGVYAINAESKEQYDELNEFPPYENELDKGEVLFNQKFANGKSYADCFDNGGVGVRQNYPYYDSNKKEVVTLELAINRCREANGEKPFGWKKGPIAQVSAYMAFTSRGNPIAVQVQDDDALDAFKRGMEFYYTKRGYLNNSCATCHVQGAGSTVRVEVLHPALGEVSHTPIHRLKWQGLGTLHRRIEGCHRDQGAAPFKAQSTEYRELEYFMTYMSNGLQVNGPDFRK